MTVNAASLTGGWPSMTKLEPKSKPRASTSRPSCIERLLADPKWVQGYRITNAEIESISNIAMMGELHSERDVLFILNQIRRARLRW
jgi:hypothetical protein